MNGSKRVMVLLQLASMWDVLYIVCCDMRMYRLKQSLVQRPMVLINHFGHPMAAAVNAAPMRSECDVVLVAPSVVECSSWFMSFLVRYFLL